MPILISCSSLNVLSYALSQISYELGECALSILELKLDKFRTRDGEVNEKLLKKAEIAKINDTCRLGLVMFAHFTCMYSPADRLQDRGGPAVVHSRKLLDGQPLHALVDMSCIEPDECKSYFMLQLLSIIAIYEDGGDYYYNDDNDDDDVCHWTRS